MNTKIISDVKNYLDMTWHLTTEEDNKLSGLVERGITYLDRIAGSKQDYVVEGDAKALLFDYVRYARSNALDEFQGNYMHELLALQMYAEVVTDDQKSP